MKPVDQLIFNDTLGDCFRACVASIFEMPIKEVPNFWEQTQNAAVFWKLNSDWLAKNKGFRYINVSFKETGKHLVDGILCIAIGESPRGKIDHAVVWQDGIIHDPHPSRAGLAEKPDMFTLFIPLNPVG